MSADRAEVSEETGREEADEIIQVEVGVYVLGIKLKNTIYMNHTR